MNIHNLTVSSSYSNTKMNYLTIIVKQIKNCKQQVLFSLQTMGKRDILVINKSNT